MQLIPETAIYGKYYSNLQDQMLQRQPGCEKILQKLSPEDQAELKEYYRLLREANETYSKYSYSIGYSHGISKK